MITGRLVPRLLPCRNTAGEEPRYEANHWQGRSLGTRLITGKLT